MSQISGIPALDNLTFGGLTTYRQNLIVLYASLQAGAANTWTAFRSGYASSGYQVTAGKTFNALFLQCVVSKGASNAYVVLLYADNDVGLNGTTAPTNGKYPASDSNSAIVPATNGGTLVQPVVYGLTFPAQKYILIYNSGAAINASCILWGYES